jgi:Flp pilus assembly protein TadD
MPKCPRCRTVPAAPDPAAVAAASRRLRKISAAIAAVFLVVVGGLWLWRGGEPPPAPVTAPKTDPLASRRVQAPIAKKEAPAAVARPFMDSSAVGSEAYSSGDLNASLAAYQAAVEKNPQDAESWSNLGQVLLRLNRVAEAVPCFDRAIAILPSRWAYTFNRARAMGLLGRWDDAIAGYRQANELFPNDYVTVYNLGLALHKKGDEAAAVTTYQHAVTLSPDDAPLRLALGISLEKLGKRTDAAEAYKEYLRLAPSAADAEQVRARIAFLAGPAPAPSAAPSTPGQ